MKNPYKNFDEYGLQHVPEHLIASELWNQYEQVMTDFQFLQIKTSRLGPQTLLQDYDLHEPLRSFPFLGDNHQYTLYKWQCPF